MSEALIERIAHAIERERWAIAWEQTQLLRSGSTGVNPITSLEGSRRTGRAAMRAVHDYAVAHQTDLGELLRALADEPAPAPRDPYTGQPRDE